MLIESQGVKSLDQEHQRQLRTSSLQRPTRAGHPVRLALANTLMSWARRLAPELPDPRLLRTRAAPN